MKRLLMTALAGVCIAAVPMVALPAHPAQAMGIDFLCTGKAELYFSPGLTNTPQAVEVDYSAELTCALSPLRVDGGFAYGNFTIPDASCTDLTTVPHTVDYDWFPRAVSSTVRYSAITISLLVPSLIVQTGQVTAGMASGDQAVSTIALLFVDLGACDTPTGLTYHSGPEELTFAS